MVLSRVLTLVLLSSLLGFPEAVRADDSFKVTQTSLADLVAETLPAFEMYSGYQFEKPPTVTIGSTEEVEAALTEELKPQQENLGGDFVAEAQARLLAPFMLGKYQFKHHRIFINPGVINRLSLLLNMPELRRRDTLAAILMHEYCHAMDHERLQIMTKPHGAETEEELIVWGHMIEGHAQFIARSVCRKHGITDAFECFTKMIGATPNLPGLDEFTRETMRSTTAALAAQYYDGERFIQALHDLGGRAAVDRALVKPPTSTMELAVPEWYLRPGSRARAPDLDQIVRGFGEAYSGWQPTQASISNYELRGQFAPMKDQGRVLEVLGGVQFNRSRVLTFNGGEKLAGAVLVKCENSFASQAYVSLSEDLSRVRDNLMRTGVSRIKSAKYLDISGGRWRGFEARKVVQVGAEEVVTTVGVAACDDYAIELLFVNEPITHEAMVAELKSLVARLIASRGGLDRNGRVAGKGVGDVLALSVAILALTLLAAELYRRRTLVLVLALPLATVAMACDDPSPEESPPRQSIPEGGSIAPDTIPFVEARGLNSWGAEVVRVIAEEGDFTLVVTCSPDRIETAFRDHEYVFLKDERATTADESKRIRAWVAKLEGTCDLTVPELFPDDGRLFVEGVSERTGYYCHQSVKLGGEMCRLIFELLQLRAEEVPQIEALVRLEGILQSRSAPR